MADLPVMLKVEGRRCVIIGGGAVALRRARALRDAGAQVRVIAPRIEPELQALPVERVMRPYQTGDLAGAWLVVIATDDAAVNAHVAHDAAALDLLLNRTDAPEQGNLTIPAHSRRGPVTLAVHTSGISAAAAATIRDQCLTHLDPDWITLLETVAPYRAPIQQAVTDPLRRTHLLKQLTDPAALATLKQSGVEALHARCRLLLEQARTTVG